MKSPSAMHMELLQNRLDLLQGLIRMQAEWRAAFIRVDLQESERSSADQQLLCDRIRQMDLEIASFLARSRNTADMVSPTDPEISELLARTAALRLELQQSNQTNLAILQRCKFTINALRNLFNSLAPTYAAPAAHGIGMLCEENV